MTRLVYILCCCLLLGACAGKTRSVAVLDTADFELMAQRNRNLFEEQGLIDAKGAYAPSAIGPSLAGAGSGKKLFENLSPAFLHTDLDPALLPDSFAKVYAARPVVFSDRGFTLKQAGKVQQVRLVAETDWSGNSKPDWLLVCREARPDGYALKDYYLVIYNPESLPWQTELLFVYNHQDKRVVNFASSSGRKNQAELLEGVRGQKGLLEPPSDRVKDNTLQAQTLAE